MIIQLNNLSYEIGEKVLFKNLNFVFENKKYAIVGINGSGKSTLLKHIASFDKHISYAKDIKIAYLPQNPLYDKHLNLLEAAKKEVQCEDYELKSSLTRFGLTNFHKKISELSGGQLKRFALALTLLKDVDVLLLDEPTNHLDTIMIEYLENRLKKFNKTLIMITHDRYFLERVTNHILELDHGQLYSYIGNYDDYLIQKDERYQNNLKAQHKRHQFLKKELEWVRSGVQARATKSKDRLKRFEELSQTPDIQINQSLEITSYGTRIGKKTIILDHVSKSYDNLLFHPFSYTFKRFDRIGILGENGCGKTTLMNCIANLTDYKGVIDIGDTVKIGYFKQGLHDLDESKRVYDSINDIQSSIQIGERTISARNLLERFLFDKHLQYTQISRLSGGEKRRLYLLHVLIQAPNVLLLDEPTNDLDIETLTILEDYLDHFQGIVITVSHDRYFLDRICDGLFVFKNQMITYHNGGYSSSISIENKKETKQIHTTQKTKKKVIKLTYKENQEFEKLTTDIPLYEQKIKEIDNKFQTLTNFDEISKLSKERNELENTLEDMNLRYLELLEKKEK